MKKNLLSLGAFLFMAIGAFAQFEQVIQGTGGTRNDTLDNGTVVVLELSTDDVEQENDEVDSYFDDDLDAGWEGAPEDQNELHMGLRFVDVTIPQGATIDSAFIIFHAHEGKSAADVAIMNIVCEATDDALTFDETNFNDNYLLTDRPATSAVVNWTVAEEWIIWQAYRTVDLSPIVQEVINRPGWTSGNAIAFIFNATDEQGSTAVENAREFTSFENIADPEDTDPAGNPGDGRNWPERRPMIKIYYDGIVSTQELTTKTFSVSPNPVTNGILNVNLINAERADIEVISITGQIVKQVNTNSTVNPLDLNDLEKGVYIVRVTQNGNSSVDRVVLK